MKIIIFGYTGMLGKAFIKHFGNTYKIIGISRKPNSKDAIETYTWENLHDVLRSNRFDVAINLCGETIGQPWHKWSKQKIYNSRINTTQRIVNALKNYDIQLISASGIGIYDPSNDFHDDIFNENINPQGFLQSLAFDWEKASNQHQKSTILRTAVVFTKNDGVLKKMLLGRQLKLLTQFGIGKNPFPWISIEDWCHAVDFIIQKSLLGPYNLTSPELSSYNSIMDVLCSKTNAYKITIPNVVVKALMGEMGESLFLNGSQALPNKLLNEGFKFKHNTMQSLEI